MSEHADNETLLGFIDAELARPRALEIEAHLERCPGCRKRYRALKETSDDVTDCWKRLAGAPADALEARSRVRRAMEADIERRWTWRTMMVLAATAALMFFFVRYESTLLHRSLIVERGALPVTSFTPGLARAISLDELCATEPPAIPRVPAALRTQVLRDYGMEHVSPEDYELDYLITPQLGGLTDRRNLWPEPYGLRSWNAHAKDQLEQRLPQLVCRGEIDLATAQREIASNWIGAYKKYLPAEAPLQLHARLLELPRSRSAIVD